MAPLDLSRQEDTGGSVVVEESYWMMGEQVVFVSISSSFGSWLPRLCFDKPVTTTHVLPVKGSR